MNKAKPKGNRVNVKGYGRLRTRQKLKKTQVNARDVISVLISDDWDYRTVTGIAKQLKADVESVEVFLEQGVKDGQVAKSVMKSQKGEKLYYARKAKGAFEDVWDAVKVAIKGGGVSD